MEKVLPDWLRSNFSRVLLGEIYPAIRAIAVQYSSEDKILLTRCYLDREPVEEDFETMEIANTEIFAAVGADLIVGSKVECFSSDKPFNMIDPLDGFIYARKEH
jgi:hypothetical protein